MKYTIETDDTVQSVVTNHYRDVLGVLEAQGFTEVICYAEKTPPFAMILEWPIPQDMQRMGEYVKTTPDLGFKVVYPVMLNRDADTFAMVLALGQKFYTSFSDGTLLISSNASLHDVVSPHKNYYKYKVAKNNDLWAFHRAKITAFLAEGKSVAPVDTFDDHIWMSKCEDEMDPLPGWTLFDFMHSNALRLFLRITGKTGP